MEISCVLHFKVHFTYFKLKCAYFSKINFWALASSSGKVFLWKDQLGHKNVRDSTWNSYGHTTFRSVLHSFKMHENATSCFLQATESLRHITTKMFKNSISNQNLNGVISIFLCNSIIRQQFKKVSSLYIEAILEFLHHSTKCSKV